MTDAREALERLLETLGESSRFVTSGSLTPILPGLQVKKVGSIGCPVTAVDAQKLIAQATQAPYGRGEETIVDTGVRRVWQIEPSQFALRNAEWLSHVTAIVDAVKQEFGISQKVVTHLYKLLIYEKGSFFAPHRDTEKVPGMFATLVVCLPSPHKGGTLIVRHDGQTKEIDFGGEGSEFRTQYAAFYADCQHEVLPVTAGYRVCLVYNLAVAGKKQPSAPQNAAAVERAARLLERLFADRSIHRNKIAIPFVHRYTQAGLDPRQLKGSDRSCLDVLVRATELLGYHCYLALLTHYQTGDIEYGTWYSPGYGRRRSFERYEDEDEDAEVGDESGVEMAEVYEEGLWLDDWLDPQGAKQPFGKMHLDHDEILSEEAREDWACEQEVHEATGNEGVSMERWYRQGAIVIWPSDRYFAILAGEGPASAVPALEQLAARSRSAATLADCRTFAEEIVNHWKKERDFAGAASFSGRMLALLRHTGTPELAHRFLRDILPKDFDGSEGKPLHRLCQQFGWASFAAALQGFFTQQKPGDLYTDLDRIVSIGEHLCCDPPALTKDRREVCTAVADAVAQVIERWDARRTQAWYGDRDARAGVVAGAVHIFAMTSTTELLDGFLAHVLADRRHYDIRGVVIPDLKAIRKWIAKVPAAQPAFSRLLEHCLTELRTATAQPIEPPRDWTRDASLSCNCEDCRMLARFLRDPEQRVGRFPLRKDRRQHLHRLIDMHQIDLTHVTERVGSPQTLVCTKTQGSYERRLNQYRTDLKLLAELETFAVGERNTAIRRSPGRRPPKK